MTMVFVEQPLVSPGSTNKKSNAIIYLRIGGPLALFPSCSLAILSPFPLPSSYGLSCQEDRRVESMRAMKQHGKRAGGQNCKSVGGQNSIVVMCL